MQRPVTQRAGIFSELPALLDEYGFDPSPIFSGSGIDPDTLDAHARIPFARALEVLDRASTQTGIAHIGLLVGLRFDLSKHHGPIGRLMMTASTLRQALLDYVAWQPGYSSGAIVYLQEFGDECAFGYDTFAAAAPGSRILHDLVIGVGMRMLQLLTGGQVRPVEIHFSNRQPEDLTSYRMLLPFEKKFSQNRTCFFG
nr:AraC family transcriptional regulator ligand-binding domain-containing protein [Marinicella sp. W31]MDC2877433.1 AraC family transcriptional regulator ligand-binding domain-containing protein [Marinicella sp. W31]